MLAEQYDPYIQYNGGFNTALGITNSGDFTQSGAVNIIWHRGNHWHDHNRKIARWPVAYAMISQWLLERLRLFHQSLSHLI